ncbi:hypothetical protein LZ31DRAFT_102782 [Colletotrichum somersetense]|nr:hypothetical protein LZ31DRAFT_102782 [Colletotrichum somersetense]
MPSEAHSCISHPSNPLRQTHLFPHARPATRWTNLHNSPLIPATDSWETGHYIPLGGVDEIDRRSLGLVWCVNAWACATYAFIYTYPSTSYYHSHPLFAPVSAGDLLDPSNTPFPSIFSLIALGPVLLLTTSFPGSHFISSRHRSRPVHTRTHQAIVPTLTAADLPRSVII